MGFNKSTKVKRRNQVMKRMSILSIVCLITVAYAEQTRFDLGINMGRDYVIAHVLPDPDGYPWSVVDASPVNIAALFNFSVTDAIKIGARGGYSSRISTGKFETTSEDYSPWDEELKVTGMRFQGMGLVNVSMFEERISPYAGVGFGYYAYVLNYEYTHTDFEGKRVIDESESKTSGIAQTFLLGCHLGISKMVGINVELEKLGINFMKYRWTRKDEKGTKVGEYEGPYMQQGGFEDIGLSLGFSLSF